MLTINLYFKDLISYQSFENSIEEDWQFHDSHIHQLFHHKSMLQTVSMPVQRSCNKGQDHGPTFPISIKLSCSGSKVPCVLYFDFF